MSVPCSEQIAQLSEIKKLQINLNNQIENFSDLKSDLNSLINEKNELLYDIYQNRKEIKRLLVEYNINCLLDHTQEVGLENISTLDLHTVITHFYKKIRNRETLNKREIVFMYDHKLKIIFSDYDFKMIAEWRSARDVDADMLTVFDCEPEQIARNMKEFDEAMAKGIEVKAYVGVLFEDFFNIMPESVENIYTEFPDSRIVKKKIKVGGGQKKKDEVKKILIDGGMIASDCLPSIIEECDFSGEERDETLAILSISDMGFDSDEIVERIMGRAKILGLNLCLPEMGPLLRVQYLGQTGDERWHMIFESKNPLGAAFLRHYLYKRGGLRIDLLSASIYDRFYNNCKLVFKLDNP